MAIHDRLRRLSEHMGALKVHLCRTEINQTATLDAWVRAMAELDGLGREIDQHTKVDLPKEAA